MLFSVHLGPGVSQKHIQWAKNPHIFTNFAKKFVFTGWAKLPQTTGQLCLPVLKKKFENLEGCQDPNC